MEMKKTMIAFAAVLIILVLTLTVDIGMTKKQVEKDANKERDVFTYGGNSPEVEEGVGVFEQDNIPAVAYVSMNKPEVSHMIIGSGDAEELIVINSDKPFAVVVEKELGMVRIFDKNDELVEPIVM